MRLNEPLIKVLTDQLCGRAPAERFARRMHQFISVPGAEDIEWETSMNAGRFAFLKAMDRFDPGKGKIAYYLKMKIRYELQCLVEKAGVVNTPRGLRPDLEYFEDDDHAGRVTAHAAELEGDDELLDVADLRGRVDFLRDMKPANVFFQVDARPVLQVLLEDHVAFRSSARCPATALRGRYRSLAERRGELARVELLDQVLLERGVRLTRTRVEWSPVPVRAFAGVGLQSAVRSSDYKARDVGFA